MKKGLDGFQLKLISIIAMVINHVGSGFNIGEKYPYIYLFTETIGKLTFPIMAYLLVEGFHHTRNKYKYAGRLALFSLISVIPFHIYFMNNFDFHIYDLTNNVLYTLLIGLLMMIVYEKTENTILHISIVIIACLLTMRSDWAIFGILIIFGYYRISNTKKKIIYPACYISIPMVLLSIPSMIYGHMDRIFIISTIGILGLLLTIPVLLKYNGKRGYSPCTC